MAHGDQPTTWNQGSGSWADSHQWSDGPPTDLRTVFVRGTSDVTVPAGRFAAGVIRLGTNSGDKTRLHILGELIVRRDFVQVGEYRGGTAEILLDEGALHVVSAIYVGGASSLPERECVGTLTVRGGSFLARSVTLGWGAGSKSTFHVVGSKPAAVHLLDMLSMGTEHKLSPCDAILAFTLDQQGVTPITIESRTQGISMTPGSAGNHCQLKIALSAIPPRDDVPLVSLRKATRGIFQDLPEGADVSARFGDREFRWTLTYKGGPSGCDVVLTKVRGHAADDPKTLCRAVPKKPQPLWEGLNSRPPLPEHWEPAFAGAEGFGAMAKGGRGGREIAVTTLADSGPGSLRAAIEAKGPRSVRFEIGGTIELKRQLDVREPFLTVDGSTAPAPGITLSKRGMAVLTHDVILRHFRIRPGVPSSELDTDALEFDGAERCIADHLSLAWATDETLSVVGLSDCITIQWCILAEPLNDHKHGYGSILGGERTTWHHNLYAHAVSRVPRFAGIAQTDFRNNVLYDWGHTAGYGQFDKVNYVANYLKPGPSTTQRPPKFHNGDSVVGKGSLYLSENVLVDDPDVSRDNHLGVRYDREVLSAKPFDFPPVVTEDAATAYRRVLESAGANLPARDQTDERIIQQTREGTGKIVDRVP